MASRPTVLYPERSPNAAERHPSDKGGFDTNPPSEPLDLPPEDHLLALREDTDYLRGILLLLNEHWQQAGSANKDADSLSAVTEHALARIAKARLHLNALTDDYLQRMRNGQP